MSTQRTSMLAMVFGLCIAGGADAQERTSADASSPGTATLQEVVVTARKVEEPLQSVPVAVTALTAADIKGQSIKSLADIEGQIPSLHFDPPADDPQSLAVDLRGRKQFDASTFTDAAAGLYIDGVYNPRWYGMVGGMLDLDRIEVLRGPQGTLYGRNTTGGAISLYTNDPTDESSGSIDLTRGNYGAWDDVIIGNTALTDNVAVRVVLDRGATDGYGIDAAGKRLAAEDNQYYRFKLRAHGDDYNAVVSAHYESHFDSGAIGKLTFLTPAHGGLPTGGALALETAAELGISVPAAVASLQGDLANSAKNWYFDPGTNPNASYVRKQDVSLNLTFNLMPDLDLRSISSAEALLRYAESGSMTTASWLLVTPFTDERYYSQEFQLLGSRPNNNWVVGLYGGWETSTEAQNGITLPELNPGQSISDFTVLNESYAVYGQDTWTFLPTWRLTAGARYSYDIRQTNDNFTATSTNGPIVAGSSVCQIPAPGVESTLTGPAQCPRLFRNVFKEPTWLISVDKKLTNDVLLYAKIARGYRSGGQNAGGATEIETFAPFKPEINLEYEVGMKSQFLDDSLRFNLAAFYDDYSNVQVTSSFITADEQLSTAVTNAATAKVEGFEAESAYVIGGATLRSSLSLDDAGYTRFVNFLGDHTHEPFDVPKWTGSVSGRYQWLTPTGPFSVQGDWIWTGTTNLSPAAQIDLASVTQKGYGLFNARATLHLNSWNADIAAYGKNVLDKKYIVNASAHDFQGLGINWAYAGAPALYGIEITKSFGNH